MHYIIHTRVDTGMGSRSSPPPPRLSMAMCSSASAPGRPGPARAWSAQARMAGRGETLAIATSCSTAACSAPAIGRCPPSLALHPPLLTSSPLLPPPRFPLLLPSPPLPSLLLSSLLHTSLPTRDWLTGFWWPSATRPGRADVMLTGASWSPPSCSSCAIGTPPATHLLRNPFNPCQARPRRPRPRRRPAALQGQRRGARSGRNG